VIIFSNVSVSHLIIVSIPLTTVYCCFIRSWIEACINETLPGTTELEEGLRNGVFLAKLGHFMAPDLVLMKKIYDKDQVRYEVRLMNKMQKQCTVE